MFKFLKGVHILALCIFVGSVPAHIVLGAVADPTGDYQSFAIFHQAKYLLTYTLTTAGVIAVILSGLLLAISNKGMLKQRWLQIKLALVALIALNGGLILTPLAEKMTALAVKAAQSGTLETTFADLAGRESIAGAANILLIITVVFIAIYKPAFGQKRA
ncbi:MAG: DUF2269 family protein [Rhodospirillales bacterium]|nr:DUF2269 family protein [Rhodospirillales bacterium]